MSIWLQKSASIQTRTSPLKFDHFRWEIPNFTAPNLSTKAYAGNAEAAAQADVLRGWISKLLDESKTMPLTLADLLEKAVDRWAEEAHDAHDIPNRIIGAERISVGPTEMPTVGIEIDVCSGDLRCDEFLFDSQNVELTN